MNTRFVLAGVLVVAIIALGSARLFQITGSATSAGESQEVRVVIDDGTEISEHDVFLVQRETAFDALKRVASVDYEMREPSVLIREINGIRQDAAHRWTCEVNGKTPEPGCDYYYPVSGDVIKFAYVKAE
jgi:hypothetical protein